MKMKTFMYRFIRSGNCYGPFKAANAKAARERVKELWADDFKTAGKRMRFELWESSQDFTGTAGYHTQYAAE